MAAEVKTVAKPVRGYLVVEEYKEPYVPGTIVVTPHWQTGSVFCFYFKYEDALARVEAEQKIHAAFAVKSMYYPGSLLVKKDIRLRIIPLEGDCQEISINELDH